MMQQVEYRKNEDERLWWCNSHRRKATSIRTRLDGVEEHCCAPGLGGILLPCSCVDLTDDLVIEDEK